MQNSAVTSSSRADFLHKILNQAILSQKHTPFQVAEIQFKNSGAPTQVPMAPRQFSANWCDTTQSFQRRIAAGQCENNSVTMMQTLHENCLI